MIEFWCCMIPAYVVLFLACFYNFGHYCLFLLKVAALTTSEKVSKGELSAMQREVEELQSRLQSAASTRASDRQAISNLERRLAEERRTRSNFESQLALERKSRKQEEARAAQVKTGKAWVGVYWGNCMQHAEWHYKGFHYIDIRCHFSHYIYSFTIYISIYITCLFNVHFMVLVVFLFVVFSSLPKSRMCVRLKSNNLTICASSTCKFL